MTKPVSIESEREMFYTTDKPSGRAKQEGVLREQQHAKKKQKNGNTDVLSTPVSVPEADPCFVLGYN